MKKLLKNIYRSTKQSSFWNRNSFSKELYKLVQSFIGLILKIIHLLTHGKNIVMTQVYRLSYLRRIRVNLNRKGKYTQLARYFAKRNRWQLSKKYYSRLYTIVKDESAEIERQNECRFNFSVIDRIMRLDEYKKQISKYNQAKSKRAPKIAIVSAVSGGYDLIRPPEIVDSNFDYIFYCDKPTYDYDIYDVRPMPFFHNDSTRVARFVKTNLHTLVPGYDYVVWIDANIMMTGDIYKIVKQFIDSKKAVGAIPHPLRKSVYEEARACKKHNKEDNENIEQQVSHLKDLRYDCNNLIESGLMMFSMKDKRIADFFDTWWREIDQFTRRDQLSLNYALDSNNIDYYPLMKSPLHIRTHKSFVIIPHHFKIDSLNYLQEIAGDNYIDPLSMPSFTTVKNQIIKKNKNITIEIIYCVHNAYEDVKKCLTSVVDNRNSNSVSLIIIDDGSDKPTADYLSKFAKKHKDWTTIKRNPSGSGYTKAANQGLKLSRADFMILLNSDTIVTNNWIEKMVDAAYYNKSIGIVGPLSSAASHQSIPDHKSSDSQTATNTLPPGYEPNDINKLCEEWSYANYYPLVPLIHGFCFGVKREVIDKIGYFSEENFPRGYGEENDYCFRATDAGFRLALATNTYVYHAKSKSYVDQKRIEYMKKGSKALQRLHGRKRITRAVLTMENNPLLIKYRAKAKRLY